MRNVTLIGGPFDGRGINWDGGDLIRMDLTPTVLDFSVKSTDPYRRSEAIYRRSVVTPHLFIFQP